MRGKALSFLVSFALSSWITVPLRAAEVWRGPSSLEVRVEDSSGKAVEGAKVRLLYQAVEPKSGPAVASTDDEGEAYFFSLAEGWWALEVTKEGALSIHSEFVLSGEKKPAVLSTFQEKTPGATQTLQVRIGRPRPGRAAGDPTGGPRVGKPAAPAPAAPPAQPAAPAPTPTPAPAPNVPSAPPSVPSPAPAVPQAPADKPAPAPSATPAVPSTPPAQPTPPPAAAPDPSPAPVPAPPVVVPQERAETPPAPPTPAPSAPTPTPTPAVASPSVPTPTPAPTPPPPPTPAAPGVAPAPVAPPTPAPAALPEPKAQRRSYAERSCLECKAGEEALSIEVSVPPGSAPCGEGLDDRLRERDTAKAEAGLPPSCRLLRVVLPPEARFTGYRFEVEDGGASRDCRAGADCPVGTCRFPLDPGIRKGPTGTAFTAAFENTSPDSERRAIFTVYFAPE